MHRNSLVRVYLFLLLPLSLINVNCGQRERAREIDFKETVELKQTRSSQGPEINICVGSMITPEEGYAYYKRLLNYIGQKLALRITFVEKRTYAEVNTLLKDGSIDVAFVCGGPYVKGRAEFDLELIAAPLVDGKAVYYSYIIVARASGIEDLEGLRGKVFAFVDPISNTGKLVPTRMLQELGESPRSFFKDYLYTYNHDNSIKAVAQGIVDGAAVDSLIWEYMDRRDSRYTKKTKIIRISRPYGIPPVVARPGLEENLKTRIKDILLKMHNDREGLEILKGMYIDRFVEIDDSDYDSIRQLKAYLDEQGP